MAQQIIGLTEELLASQAQEMTNLKIQYEQLFQQVSSTLREVNESWSEYLANNFAGKIQSAQKGFSNVALMLANGAEAATLGITNIAGKDSYLSKVIEAETSSQSITTDNAEEVSRTLTSDFWQQKKEDYDEVMEGVAAFDDYVNEKLTPKQKKLLSKMAKELGLGDEKDAYEIIALMSHGKYGEASQKLGKKGLDEFFKKYYGPAGSLLSDYSFNFIDSTASALTESYINDPSWENLLQVPWNMTVKPVVDTCGKKVWDIVSEYFPNTTKWYEEHGATDYGSAFNVALTEGYRAVLGDEAADYASTYYADHGGVFHGVYDGLVEIGGYVKDQVNNLFDTSGWFSFLR